MSRISIFLTAFLAVSSFGAPVEEAVVDVVDGTSGTLVLLGDLTGVALQNAQDAQGALNNFVVEQLERRTNDPDELGKSIGQVAEATLAEVRETAKASENILQTTLEGVGDLAKDTTRLLLNGVSSFADATRNITQGTSLSNGSLSVNTDVMVDTGENIGQITDSIVDGTVLMARNIGEAFSGIADKAIQSLSKFNIGINVQGCPDCPST